jgi:hypothetical protein
MLQDFSKKMVIVVRNDLPSWQVLNTVAHASAYLGNKMKEPFDTGASFFSKDGVDHPRNSQFPIVALSAKPGQMTGLMEQVRASGLLYLGFVREMIETTDDAELETRLAAKDDKDMEYLGIGLFGENDKVKALTKKFSLWK